MTNTSPERLGFEGAFASHDKSANFKISIELEKLKIHVEGAREIAPEIASNVASQISAVFQPAGYLEPPNQNNGHNQVVTAPAAPATRKPRKRSAGAKPDASTSEAISWTHDPTKWGTPIQGWSQAKRIMWLLQVIAEATGRDDGLTPDQITATFNTKFKDAVLLAKGNIKQNLSNASQSDYFGAVEGRWFLKQKGKTEAAKLIAEAKGQQPA